MQIRRLASIPVALLLLVLTACGGSSISKEHGAKFISHVREFIPSTQAYSDEMLLDMAEHVCQLGNTEDGVRILDNYSDLEPDDYEPFAISALDYACPGKG